MGLQLRCIVYIVTMNCSFSHDDSPCSAVGSSSTVVTLDSCKQDITTHLISLGVSSKRGWRTGSSTLSEKDLILNRAGVNEPEDNVTFMTVCPKHRQDLTWNWPGRKRKTCCYPSHKGEYKQMKDPRRVNFTISQEILTVHNAVVPVGSGECCVVLYLDFDIITSEGEHWCI